ncbi:Prolipoprotein diacylglyceryl transferase [Kosakonia radicincitans]|uniref:glycosyltransferase family 52 n=1 Tax=Kosakonia radicincitans TaxID=283686 RepID=UPI0009A8B05E|nr:glycosyltransferase family 52 [Kosakonia radicincitans]SKC20600.1 Prolipoprotein diacylglyceryl transferase [Kosakonia radicincitans]
MNLIVCFTPLQVLIALQAIKKEDVDLDTVKFIYFSSIANGKHKKYYDLISQKAGESKFITDIYSLRLLHRLKEEFKNASYDKVFLASLDDSISHYLLSFVNFKELVTFDDGLGNILKTGSYFVPHPRKTIKKRIFTLVHFLLGRKYYLDTLKKRSDRHYTIYRGFENCVANAIAIPLFDFPETIAIKENSVDVFLGTVYKEIVCSGDEHELKLDLLSYIKNKSPDARYIPHPRARDSEFTDFEVISDNIAEETVMEFLNAGFVVNLYGFASSCQFNLSGVKDVNIFVLDSPRLSSVMKDGINMLACTLPSENHIHI